MILRHRLCALTLLGLWAFTPVAVSREPVPAPPAVPMPDLVPPAKIPLADAPPTPPKDRVAKVKLAEAGQIASVALPQALAESRQAVGKLRDYQCHLIRQESVNGALLPEQVAELRVRSEPFSVLISLLEPKALKGEATRYLAAKSTHTVQYRLPGLDGIKYGFQTLTLDDEKAMKHTRHTAAETGMLAVLDRMSLALQTEAQLRNPIQILQADYTYAGRRCTRFEVFADRPHPNRMAHRLVLLLDSETKFPIRFEAYSAPKSGGMNGELIEAQSFINLKTNVGLGEAAFGR